MSETSQQDLPKDATAEEIEADIAATRARLSESVDALADKVDVKGQAQRKVADTKAQAAEKVHEVKAQAGEKVGQAREQVRSTSQTLLARFQAASRPVQVSIGAAPLALLILIVIRRARR